MATILPAQCRAGRALLDWTQTRLATEAGLDAATVNAFERRKKNLTEDSLLRIRQALEAKGVIFLNSGSPGVRLSPDVVRSIR
ncbi:helix-turn-helix domain-containing protein [Haliangium sp. UPWRP_2]|uniref:helix-turn-helix domain-containing protein n=1 Tax=Haliangium sp. UPWRP_2 TaxID=1931276 RepID=UPI0018EDF429